MLNLITHPNKILTEVMPDFDFQNPIIDPYQLEEDMMRIPGQLVWLQIRLILELECLY